MRHLLGVTLLVGLASTASAQSTYVGASFIADVVRTSGTNFGGETGGGETFGGALRVGTPLGRHWGVELEFALTGEIETTPGGVFPAGFPAGSIEWNSGSLSGFSSSVTSSSQIFLTPRFESERRLSTISTLLWWNHELSDGVSLVYLGGVAFTRTTWQLRISYPDFPVPPIPLPLGRPTIFPPPDLNQESTSYGADVAVGFEGRIRMTDDLRLVPGIRLQTISGGWAIRPGVGLQWTF
jgi:TonB dependent receptor